MRRPHVPAGARFQPVDVPGYERPWAFPGILWKVPWWPVRMYLHAGDRVLFLLWYHSRGVMWKLEDLAGATGSYTYLADREVER